MSGKARGRWQSNLTFDPRMRGQWRRLVPARPAPRTHAGVGTNRSNQQADVHTAERYQPWLGPFDGLHKALGVAFEQ